MASEPTDYDSELVARAANPDLSPGAGAICGSVLQLAAALVLGIARASAGSWPDAAGTAAQAKSLLQRADELAQENAANYSDALAALRDALAGKGSPEGRLAERLDAAASTPRRIAEVAADVAEIAAAAAREAESELRPDAAGAAQLAAAAAVAAAGLVRVNLITTPNDPRLEEAELFAGRARESAARATDSIAQL